MLSAPTLAAAPTFGVATTASAPVAGEVAVRLVALTKSFPVQRGWRQILLHPRTRPHATVVRGVSLDVARGELFGVLGPNGAGKTTLFKMLSTAVTPDSGSAAVLGHNVEREGAAVRRLVGCVMANDRSLYWRLSATENLRLFAALHGLPRGDTERRVRELLAVVKLSHTGLQMAGTFSSGMKQRLLVARALLPCPQVLLLDEPTRSMDPVSARQFRDFLRAEIVGRQGCTVLLATHNSEEAFGLCDRVCVLARGQLLAVGTVEELNRRYNDQRFGVWTREPAHPEFALLARTGLVREMVADSRDADGWAIVQFVVPGGSDQAQRVLAALTGAGVSVARFERTDRSIASLIEGVIGPEEEAA